jgi:parvulin-like peptidyl-prolyl isomerase
MCFKKVRLSGIAGAVLAAATLAAAPVRGQERVVDGIVALVNDRIITLIDVQIVESFKIVEGSSGAGAESARPDILEKLINQKVVLDLFRGRSAVELGRVDEEIDRLSSRLGDEAMAALLSRFGIGMEDLRPYVAEKLGVETVVAERFGRSVTVSLDEIEARYRDRYAPAERAAGRPPRPFLEAVDALEKEIREEKTAAQSALWIQTLREQAEIEVRPDLLKY